MEFFQSDFFTALLSIVIIDLVLGGDNAIVIGLAARHLPKSQQKEVIIWGTVGAIVIRAIATLTVVWLLKIPGLLFVGGVLLVWIACNLLIEEKDGHVRTGNSVWSAIRTIIIADALMGLDNVLAVAGASHNNPLLVIIGLLISIPIVVWGSAGIVRAVNRFPIIITIGAGVLAWTASKMIVEEPYLSTYFHNSIVKYGFELFIVLTVIVFGMWKKNKNAHKKHPIKEKHSL